MHVPMFMNAHPPVHLCVPVCMHVSARTHRCVISPGTLQASRDEEVLEVKAGDLVLQRRLLLHSGGGGGGDASGPRPSQAHNIAKPQAKSSAWLGGEAGLQAGRMVTGRESAVKSNAILLFVSEADLLCRDTVNMKNNTFLCSFVHLTVYDGIAFNAC